MLNKLWKSWHRWARIWTQKAIKSCLKILARSLETYGNYRRYRVWKYIGITGTNSLTFLPDAAVSWPAVRPYMDSRLHNGELDLAPRTRRSLMELVNQSACLRGFFTSSLVTLSFTSIKSISSPVICLGTSLLIHQFNYWCTVKYHNHHGKRS